MYNRGKGAESCYGEITRHLRAPQCAAVKGMRPETCREFTIDLAGKVSGADGERRQRGAVAAIRCRKAAAETRRGSSVPTSHL